MVLCIVVLPVYGRIIEAALKHCTVGSLVISVGNCIGISYSQEAKCPELSNSVATLIWCLTCKCKIDVIMALYSAVYKDV